MVTPELLDYIRAESARGVDKNAITQALIGSGWPQQDVNDAFVAFAPPPPPAMPSMPVMPPSVVVPQTVVEVVAPVLAEPEPVIAPVMTPVSATQTTSPVIAPAAQPATSLEAKVAKIEMTYDAAVEKVNELGGTQRQIVTDSVKKLEERKIDEIKKRLLPS
jgi:hypothetical protein